MIGPLILGVGTAIGILALAMGAQGLVATLKKASSAFGALNTIMSLNPAVLIVALIAGLVVAFVTLWKNAMDSESSGQDCGMESQSFL